jgi:hypothetical protein
MLWWMSIVAHGRDILVALVMKWGCDEDMRQEQFGEKAADRVWPPLTAPSAPTLDMGLI